MIELRRLLAGLGRECRTAMGRLQNQYCLFGGRYRGLDHFGAVSTPNACIKTQDLG